MKSVRGVGVAVGLALLLSCSDEQNGLLEGTNQEAGFTDGIGGGGGGFGGGTFAPPTIKLEGPAAAVNEGSTLTVTIKMSNASSESISIPFTVTFSPTAPNTAGPADVLTTATSPIVIPAGQTSATVVFTVLADGFQEEPQTETFKMTLGTPSRGSVSTTAGSLTLSIKDTNDDGLASSISGRVTDGQTGTGISGVTVNGGGVTTTSDALGFYKITSPTPASAIVVSFAKAGYVPQNRTTGAVTTARSAAVVNVPMLAVTDDGPFDPTAAHVTTVGNAQVSFSANSMENNSGGAPSGNVTASVTPIPASTDVNLLPGMYTAGDGTVPLESFGGLAISVVDGGGNAMRLKAGQTAQVQIPAATRGTALPATLKLYLFDAATGIWTEQGNAALGGVAPDQYYQGVISAFGTYGASTLYGETTVTGCVVDQSGSRVGEATVVAEGTDHITSSSAVTLSADNPATATNELGTFTLKLKDAADAFVQANFRTGISSAKVPSGATLEPCLVVYAGAAVIKLTWGDSPSDLDSHTLGPNQNSHTYWISKGSLTQLPFVGLDVDDVTGYGPEVTTIVKAAKSRKYRFMVRNYSQSYSPNQTGSPAKVELFVKGKQYVFTPPAGEVDAVTDVWHVFDLGTDAACEVTTITPITVAPWLTLSDSQIGEPAQNPNTDNAATFCN